MAQDYDRPKDKDDDDDDEETVKSLAGAQNDNDGSDDGDDDDDEEAIAENYELPGAVIKNADSSVTVIPTQEDEFICSNCFLVKHRSQFAYMKDGQPICKECAAEME